jgi:FKBP-type peptidyl-prolyl cis-trans isomerase
VDVYINSYFSALLPKHMKITQLILIFLFLPTGICFAQRNTTQSSRPSNDTTYSRTGLKYLILKKGKGILTKSGHEVLIFETASYASGQLLFTNEKTDRPVKVLIGGHQATEGEDEGLRGMQVGEVRKMFIPNYLCRRSGYPPNISPDSPIVVKVILHKILNNVR